MPTISYFDNLLITFYKGHLKEETHYYPYGMALQISPTWPTDNKNLYQTKELTRTAGANAYNIYNFEARQYDPLLGRFTSIDPMGQFASGYVGMGNNPVNGVNPDGMWTTFEITYSSVLAQNNNEWKQMENISRGNERENFMMSVSIFNTIDNIDYVFNEAEQRMSAFQDKVNTKYTNALKVELRKLLPADAQLENVATETLERILNALLKGKPLYVITCITSDTREFELKKTKAGFDKLTMEEQLDVFLKDNQTVTDAILKEGETFTNRFNEKSEILYFLGHLPGEGVKLFTMDNYYGGYDNVAGVGPMFDALLKCKAEIYLFFHTHTYDQGFMQNVNSYYFPGFSADDANLQSKYKVPFLMYNYNQTAFYYLNNSKGAAVDKSYGEYLRYYKR